MKKIYYVWKDPKCNGVNPEWIEMRGRAFYQFIKLPENKHRKFLPLDCAEYSDDILYFECNKEEHYEWRKKYSRKKYQCELTPKYSTVSLEISTSEVNELTLHESIPDESKNTEDDIVHRLDLRKIGELLCLLTDIEKKVIIAKYWTMSDKTDKEISIALGMSTTSFNNRKMNAIKKLKRVFENSRD